MPTQKDRSVPYSTAKLARLCKAAMWNRKKPVHWEVGTRYDNGALSAEMGLFLINFNNQYDSNQTNDTVTARGKTRHSGLETQTRYDLGDLNPQLENLSVYASYAYVKRRHS